MGHFEIDGDVSELFLEHVPAAVALFDLEMRYLACSRRWISDYGIKDQDIIGKSHYDVFPKINASLREIHRRVLAGESLSGKAVPCEGADGRLDWVEWSMVPWHDRSGQIAGAMLFTLLVNELVHAGQQVKLLHNQLSLFVESAQQYAITILDRDGKVVVWNAGAECLYGWSEAEALGRHYRFLYHGAANDGDEVRAFLDEAFLNRGMIAGSYADRSWRKRKDGSLFFGEVTIIRNDDDAGNFTGFSSLVRDLTQERAQMQRFEASEAQLRAILDTVPDAMVTINERGIIQSFSAAAEHLFGYGAQEVIGRNVAMLMGETDAQDHDQYLAHYCATGERRIIGNMRCVTGRRKDGTLFPHELYVGEAISGSGRVFTGFLRDLTARQEAEDKLHSLQNELLHISRVSAVGTLATALAHELNQPLTAIANYVQSSAALLTARKAEEEVLVLAREAMEEAGREALRAGDIVQRLREFISRGDLDRAIMSPCDLVAQARTLGAIASGARGVACEVAVPVSLSPVLVDRVQIQQVLLNLIRNAVEVLDDGGVVAISACEEGQMVRISVVDNGPGIAPGAQASLFEPFVSGKSTGMGIGLVISRTIIEAHGGQLWHESVAGGGAAFHFTLPIVETGDV